MSRDEVTLTSADGGVLKVPLALTLIYDHAPWPGPLYWDWRCRVCSEDVNRHAGIWARWRWRRRQRHG